MAYFDQHGQQVQGPQINAGRDVNVPLYVPPKPPAKSPSQEFAGCLIAVIFLLLFFLFIGGMLYFGLTITGILSPTPDQALSHFCNDLSFHDFTKAYNLYSSNLKQTVSFTDFSNQWSSIEVESCYPSISTSSNEKSDATLTITQVFSHASKTHTVTLIKDGFLDWKIDSISELGP